MSTSGQLVPLSFGTEVWNRPAVGAVNPRLEQVVYLKGTQAMDDKLHNARSSSLGYY